jgi:hypothetical protein
MTFTTAEKLQIAMLRDLAKPAQKRELDFDFIGDAVLNDDLWAVDWKYSGLQLRVPTPPDVKLVCDVLDMWDRLEHDFAALSPAEKATVQTGSYNSGPPHFEGFDGNNETELMHIAGLLVNDLDRWSRFKGRELNSHMPSIDIYNRLLGIWQPIWDVKVKQLGNYKLMPDEMIAILRERIHPTHRQPLPGGGWTFDPAKLSP